MPNFTAFLLVLILSALKREARWGALVPDDAARLYRAFVAECCRESLFFRLLRAIPDTLKLKLIDRLAAFGYPQHMALRKQEVEARARAAIAEGVKQVVVIGAGFDALAWRLASEFPGVRFYELDVPATQRVKCAVLEGFGSPPNLHFLPCDLSKTPLAYVLGAAPGFVTGLPTLFIAEGLTMYLTDEENRAWLAGTRALAGAQARVVASAIEITGGSGAMSQALRDSVMKKQRTKFKWALPHGEMGAFLRHCGFHLVELKPYAELQKPLRTEQEYARLTRQPGEYVFYATAV